RIAQWNLLAHSYAQVPATAVLNKWEVTNFCKCICFGSNYTILQMHTPDNPNKPCLSCTKQWCLNQNLPICAGASLGDTDPDTATGKEGDVEARCFQRDSPRDQLVVTLFLLTVLGLLLSAGIKSRMLKAGMNPNLSWSPARRWWEEWLPRGDTERYTLRERTASYPPNTSDDRGGYREISETLPM
ncbi:hypothetical protein ID866_3808, partial [Astraeus odoratus]